MRKGFDLKQAEEILESINRVSGLGASLFLLEDDGTTPVCFSVGACREYCPHCPSVPTEGSSVGSEYWAPECSRIHRNAAKFADRFGGRYFYLCDLDRIFFAAPIVSDGGLVAAMTVGPVHIFSEDEEQDAVSSGRKPFPVRDPSYTQYLSNLLSHCAASVSRSSQDQLRFVRMIGLDQQSQIHQVISRQKVRFSREYPIVKEEALSRAIQDADAPKARMMLDDLIAMIMISETSFSLLDFAEEMVTICEHSALLAGVNSDLVFDSAVAFREELGLLRGQEQICLGLRRFMEQMVFLVSRLRDVGYDDPIYRVVEYVRVHSAEKIRLDQVAETAGFSPSYFSRVFKRKMGVSFSEYLNQVRIDAAKSSLLATDRTLAEIARSTGFEDAGYFSRVFKRIVGVTPGYYRSHRGQFDSAKEHVD